MEIEDEDVVVHGTDLHKYLNAVGYSGFQVSEKKQAENLCPQNNRTKEPKNSKKINRPTQNYKKDFGLCITLIKIIIESQLIFKEDTLFIKEFIPSDHIESPLILTKRNSFALLILCLFCAFLNMFFPKYCDEWTIIGIISLWFGILIIEILLNFIKKRSIKKTFLTTIKSMEKLSLLVQKTTHFLHECNNLHSFHNSYNDTNANKNVNVFMYLLMPELKSLLLTVIQDLINFLVKNISEVHTFFPLKDSVTNVAYLYHTDCSIDLKNTSLENINKAKYTFFLLQSELLKQSGLCLCPALWTPKSFSQINRLIKTIGEIEKVYSNLYNVLFEEYNIYSLFKNNNKSPDKNLNFNSDLKLKVYNVRQFLQNMMVHVRFMEDSVEKSSECFSDDINNTLNVLVKEANVLNELISTLQIYSLKTNNDNKKDKTCDPVDVINHIDMETNESINIIREDELFFGISEELTEEKTNTFCDEVFDKSNNKNLMLELKVALKEKQEEWKQRECKLLEKHPQLYDLQDEEEHQEDNDYIHKVRKVASDLSFNENISMQLPSINFANEIAMVASKWNTVIESYSDDSDSDESIKSTGSVT